MARTLYMQELESVRQNLIQMGETATALLTEAIHAVSVGGPVSRNVQANSKPGPIISCG